MIEIQLPVSSEAVRALNVGDEVAVSGVMITARDAAHKHLVENFDEEIQKIISSSMIYHCGPVVGTEPNGYRFIAAGPTTSTREEPYEAEVIRRYGVRGIIGKGGMGKQTLAALVQYGAVYLHAIGGLGVILAQAVKKVLTVHKLKEFGVPEAMWVIEVNRFPAVVTMDSHGKSLHADVLELSQKKYEEILERIK